MKERHITWLSLAISVCALAYAAWVHHHSKTMATQALKEREEFFVSNFAPRIRDFYLGLTEDTNVFLVAPKTLEELFEPMLKTMNQLGQTEPEAANPQPQKSP